MRKKPRHAHYRKRKSYDRGDTAICGKVYYGWRRTVFVHDLNETTCPRCIEELKKEHWFCPEHGFIDGEHVTYEERCSFCGKNV